MEDTTNAPEEEVGDQAIAVEEVEEPQVDPTGRVVKPAAKEYHWGTGRRKTSVARVRIRPGSGQVTVNGRDGDSFLQRQVDRNAVVGPLKTLGVHEKIDVFSTVSGGGPSGQAGALRLGIARALLKMYPDSLIALRGGNHLTRDPRMVERKKYGLRGARRAFQWVKR
jgi:small subunit ribosomal protein S9